MIIVYKSAIILYRLYYAKTCLDWLFFLLLRASRIVYGMVFFNRLRSVASRAF